MPHVLQKPARSVLRNGEDTRIGESILRRASVLVLLVSIGSCAGLISDRKVDVGGFRLRLHCMGRGAPTVVLDSGLGDPLETWSWVQPEIARFTRVCALDRAGLGGSDVGPFPRTSSRIVREQHELLSRAGVEGPYVLVGHSFGGVNQRLYACEYPAEVAGLILVDATHEDYLARERTLRFPRDYERLRSVLSVGSPAARSELESLDQSLEQLMTARPLPDVPLTVVTAGSRSDPRELSQVWMELQKRLAGLLPRSEHLIASRSGHYVQYDRPDVVIDAVRKLIETSRAAAPARRAPAPP